MKKVKIGKYKFHSKHFEKVDKDAIDFISKLLVYDPEKRMTVEEALKHKWISNCENEEIDENVA
jgi:serine/threonine protein kinase